MKTLPRAIFFGNEQLATSVEANLSIISSVHNKLVNIVAIVTNEHAVVSRKKHKPSPIQIFAKENSITLYSPNNPSEILDELRILNADCGILVAYGRIIKQNLIDIFPKGIINIHPSPLPKLRGPTPLEQTILNGEEETGVSIMKLTSGMDEGPVYASSIIKLTGAETKQELANILDKDGSILLNKHLSEILSGSLTPKEQDNTKATYCNLITKEMGILDPEKYTATELERQVRAYTGWPKSRYNFFDVDIVVTKAHISNTATDLNIRCYDGKYLCIDEIIGPSGKTMDGSSFIRGYKK